MKLPVLVHGTIRLTSEGRQLSVRFDGNLIRIESPRLWDLRAWVNTLGKARGGQANGKGLSGAGNADGPNQSKSSNPQTKSKPGSSVKSAITAADAWLRKADLRVELRIGGQTIARLGGDAKPTWVSRWLGLSPMQLEAGPLVWALFKW